jgi:hypothetical protein
MPKKTTKKDTLEKPINRKLQAHVALISKNYAGHVNTVDRTHKSLHRILGSVMSVGNLCLDK